MFGNGFYNPYMYQPYYQTANIARNLGGLARTSGISGVGAGKAGLSGLLSKFSFSGFLNGASKTLNVVNQAIPIFYQVKPIINNAKTMFKIMNVVKNDDQPKKSVTREIRNQSNESMHSSTQNVNLSQTESIENPVFFI